MAIIAEYCPDLALRNIKELKEGRREESECLPEALEEGKEYPFLKNGQKHYWLLGEIPLRETKGGGVLSKPKASVIILESAHFLRNGEVWTKGRYKVVKVLSEDKVYFDGYERVEDARKFRN
ncbi:MAG: hypothetical protein WC565_00420 [Parcubacteria group bacterium]